MNDAPTGAVPWLHARIPGRQAPPASSNDQSGRGVETMQARMTLRVDSVEVTGLDAGWSWHLLCGHGRRVEQWSPPRMRTEAGAGGENDKTEVL